MNYWIATAQLKKLCRETGQRFRRGRRMLTGSFSDFSASVIWRMITTADRGAGYHRAGLKTVKCLRYSMNSERNTTAGMVMTERTVVMAKSSEE